MKLVKMVTIMMLKIAKNRINEFLAALKEEYTLYAPTSNGVTKFEKIEDLTSICFLPNRTDISLKSIFFPPKQKFFRWKRGEMGYELEDYLDGEEKKVIFGARGCDIRSLKILDMYMRGEFSDPYYEKRRKNTIIIGISCDYPRESCFCSAFGGMVPEDGYDLWFTDIGTHYFVDVGSDIGKELISLGFFQEASPEDLRKKKRRIEKVQFEIERRTRIDLCEVKRCSQEIKKKSQDEIWRELGEICLCCGKCNFVCPTCHCFDVRDIPSFDGSEGYRIRVWDSCHLYEYAKTSAENFRKEKHARVRYRVYDKFVFPVMRYGVYACTGCGRCTEVCPAGINLREVLRRLVE